VVVDLHFSADGKSLVSASYRSILRWDVATGVPSARVARTSKRGRDIAVDERHGIALATDERGGMSLWEIESGRFLATLGSHTVMPLGMAYAAEHDLAAVGTSEGTVLLFQPGARKLVREVAALVSEVRGLVFSPDGATLYAAGTDGTVVAVDMRSGAVRPVARHDGRLLGLSASHDKKALLLAGQDGVAARLDLATKTEIVLGKFPGRLPRLAASPDGRTIAVPSSDGNVYLLDTATGRRRSFVGNRSEVNVVAFDPSGKILAVGGDDHTVRLFDVEKGEPLWRPDPASIDADADAGAPTPGMADAAIRYRKAIDGVGTVVAFENGSIEIRSEKDGSVRALRDTPSRPSTRVLAGPAGTLALGFEDGTFGLWDTALGLALDRVTLHGAVVGLRIDASGLRGTSELGDTATVALGALSKDYCELLAEVRKDVPYIWRDGAIAPEARALPCRRP
jgi:DNA-binding beta-propeller fold protein YncE